jgi:hypothetical protein
MRAAITLAILIGTAGGAWAQSTGPVIAIPGRPGVPVIINGVDASYAVVEGDWGLGKGVHHQPTVYGGHPLGPPPPVGHYYPSAGHRPGVGRFEIESADKPKPAPAFRQSWSAGSRDADPLVPQAPLEQVPQYPPPVIMAPQPGEPGREYEHRNNPAITRQDAAPAQQGAPLPQRDAPVSPGQSAPMPQQGSPAPRPEAGDHSTPQHRQ